MNMHKRIIGILWIATGLILLVLLLLTLYNATQQHAAPPAELAIAAALLGIAQLLAGYTLLTNLRWSHWLNLPLSVLSLPNIPFGTLIGGYYLWYYIKHEWKHSEVPPIN